MALERLDASPDSFRDALASFATSVNVITTWGDGGNPCGMTATAFSSVSLEPLLVLACINRSARTYEHVASAGRFAVNILGSAAREIADYCARPGGEKTLDPSWLAAADRWASPALAGALVVLDCEVDQNLNAGTHAVLIGRVGGIGVNRHHLKSEPLLHFRGAYRQLQMLMTNGASQPKPLPIVLEEFS